MNRRHFTGLLSGAARLPLVVAVAFLPLHVSVLSILLGFGLLLSCSEAGRAQGLPVTKEQQAVEKARLLTLAKADWQRMLHRLKIRLPTLPPVDTDPARPSQTVQHPGFSSWFDAQNRRYVRSSWGSWSNYDEAKAGPSPLTDPLLLQNGKPVRDAKMWWNQRRPEILTSVARDVYGIIPKNTPTVTFVIADMDTVGLGGRVVRKTIEGRIDNRRYPAAKPRIELILYIPVGATGPVPVVLIIGSLPATALPAQPGVLAQVLAAGWAMATYNPTTVQQDSGAGLHEGIIGLVNNGQDRQPDDWGTLAAWSWGLSRALDYLETDAAVDARQVALQGHSRWGKTALLAAALDTRWSMAFVSCSGAMGASLEKRNGGETIDNVAEANEYHWMAGNFLRYAGNWLAMPTDAHELIALVAPRPVFITSGTEDAWTDATGIFLAGVGASPVYKLLGKRGLATTTIPTPGTALMDGDVAFREHVGGHTDLPDWPIFLDFARRYFHAKGAK